jgi:hypothetical protein
MEMKRNAWGAILHGLARLRKWAAPAGLLCVAVHAHAAGLEDAINAISKPGLTTKSYFAIIDIKSGLGAEALAEATLKGMRRYATGANLSYKIPPAALPPTPGRMQLVSNGGPQAPRCDGEVFNIVARDASMMKYAEGTVSMVCVFAYRGGYQLDYFATFLQGTGGANPNVLGAMLGRLVTTALGIGDSSTFVGKTITAIQEKLAEGGATSSLIELFPAIEGLQVARAETPEVPLPAQPAAQVTRPATGAIETSQFAPVAATESERADVAVPAELTNAMTQVNQQLAAARVQMVTSGNVSPLQARKELTAMGLIYHDQAQFLSAIRRGDALAVKLFLAGQGIDLAGPDVSGTTPLQAAERRERPNQEIVTLLRSAGAQ